MPRITITKDVKQELLGLVDGCKGVQIANMDKGFERWKLHYQGVTIFITCNLSTREIKSISQE